MVDVELRGVSKAFGSYAAVQDVSLSVRQGEFLTLLGPSGCGKTTTLRMIAGLETPTSGEVYVRGQRVDHLPPFRRDTALVFQSYALFPHKSVFDNVAFGLKYHGVPRSEHAARVREALEIVRLSGYERRYPGQLSGGQQQRIALARALVLHPTVLLLDEPLSNLDQKLREQMRLEIKQIQERVGITFILVTHDQEEAMAMSDRMVLMNLGKVVQQGPPREVYLRPNSRFAAEFLGRSNFLGGTMAESRDTGCTMRSDGGITLHLPPQPGVAAGARVEVQVRAERVLLQSGPQGSGNRFPGTVTRRVFLGNRAECQIRVGEDEELVAITLESQAPEPGTPVWVCIGGEDCVVLNEAAGWGQQ